MKYLFSLAVGASLLTEAFAGDSLPRETQAPAVDRRAEEFFYVLQPPDRAQIPLNPPSPDKVKGSIGVWTEYLTDIGGTTSWIGPDPSYIVEATTTQNAEGADVTTTVNKAVDVIKNANGGLDMILSPAFREKVEAILKDVPPCTKRRLRRRQGPACGIEAARARLMEDEGVADMFSEEFHGEVTEEAGLNSDADSGYGTDEDGFVEGAEGPAGSEAGETVETIIIGSEADAAAIAAAAGEIDGAIVVGGITLTAVTFLGLLMKAVDMNGKVEPVYQIPPEDVQTVTKSKSETQSATATATTTTAASCPTGYILKPDCEEGCHATTAADAQATESPGWTCSEGKNKGCKCNPPTDVTIHSFFSDFDQAILTSLEKLKNLAEEPDEPEEPEITCPSKFSAAPSEFFGKIAEGFCDYIKDNFDNENKDLPFDIDGGKIPRLSRRSHRIMQRSPPESREYYRDYVFWVSWIPKEGECLMERDNICTAAFEKLVKAQPCGQNHGSSGDRMTIDAKIDVGCGEFKWNVEAPKEAEPEPEPPGLGGQECYDKHSHTDVQDGVQDSWASNGCRWFAEGKNLKPGDKEVYWGPPGITGHAHMNYKISWKEDCTGHDEQSLQDPLSEANCYDLMRQNYKACNNGGAGGYRDAGCLRYEFYVK
ncbi:hypothetical protein F66182_7105 [Fusarium sp. NRRL 66182]|nr:hypothetical protein F66182_7105 [Fusarium sp. NRRL 66182]